MDFKFNFESSNQPTVQTTRPDEVQRKPLRKHTTHQTTVYEYKTTIVGSSLLHYVDPSSADKELKNERLREMLESTDLLAGEYEGGLKIWECTFDLLEFLRQNAQLMAVGRVLDLGCGSGLLGVYSCLNGAERVTFQDYNEEVVEAFTVPSVRKNCDVYEVDMNVFDFYSGDWKHFASDCREKFDLILSSETIYNTKCYPILLNILQNCLKRRGLALFAAKSFYFGVGGCTFEFMKFVKNNSNMEVQVAHATFEGLKREIIKIRKV